MMRTASCSPMYDRLKCPPPTARQLTSSACRPNFRRGTPKEEPADISSHPSFPFTIPLSRSASPHPPSFGRHHPHLEPQRLARGHHLAEDVAVRDRNVIAHVVGHHRLHRASHVGRHERPLPRRPLPPRIPHLRRQLHDF